MKDAAEAAATRDWSTSRAGLNRREVLLAGMAGAGASLWPNMASARVAAEPETALGAVFDQRFTQSIDFAMAASRQGIRPLGFVGDMSQLWFDGLLPALQVRPQPLVGLTSARGLFCFEQLAWGTGLRVALRIEHGDLSRLGQPSASGAGLDAAAVLSALRCKADWSDCTHADVPSTDGLGAEALVAWVIAPSRTL